MNIFKSFGVYTVAGVLGKIASFLLLPFFTHYLTEGDYGLLNIFSNSVYFITPFMTLGIGETFSVEYTRFSKQETKEFISTSLLLPLCIFLISASVLIAFSGFFQSTTGLSVNLLFFVVLLSVFTFFTEYVLVVFRNQNKAVHYASFNLIKTTFELVLAVVLIKFLHQGAMGRVNSMLYTATFGSLFAVGYLMRNELLGVSFSKKWLSIILGRGIPTIPLFFMIFVLGSADKYILNYYYGNEIVGVYSLGWQFAMVITIIISAFITPFYPFLYQSLEKGQYVRILKVVVFYFTALVVLIFSFILVLPYFFQLMIAPAFYKALNFISYMLFGQLFWGLFLILVGYIYYKRRNKSFYYLCPAVIVLTIGIDYLLLVKYPVHNFALVSFLSYLLCFLLGVCILRNDLIKLYPIVRHSIKLVSKKSHETFNR